jgi:hypothetical protein
VQAALESLQRESEHVNTETGEVFHGVSFFRERSVSSSIHGANGTRFDFSVIVAGANSKREFLIEVHGKQHYAPGDLGDKVRYFDFLKAQWADLFEIPLLVLSYREVQNLHYENKLRNRIVTFLKLKQRGKRSK